MTNDEKLNSEEWKGWKIVSEMLDNPDENGIYSTSKCYEQLYDFVCKQKNQALSQQKEGMKKDIKDCFWRHCQTHDLQTNRDCKECDKCVFTNNIVYNIVMAIDTI